MNHDHYSDAMLRDVFASVKTIALVGASANPSRPSHGVMDFLLKRGYAVTPVNPGLAGQILLGQTVVATVADVSAPIDMIDVFRNSATIPNLVEEILAMANSPKVVWMQLGVVHEQAAEQLEQRGITVIMNRCPLIEMPRLGL